VDLTAIVAALAVAGAEDPGKPKSVPRTRSGEDWHRHAQLEQELEAAKARIAALEEENRELNSRLTGIAALAAGAKQTPVDAVSVAQARPKTEAKRMRPLRVVTSNATSGDGMHPAARKLLIALAQHAPARFTWGQAATLAGLKPSCGHFNAGRKSLRESGYVEETNDLLSATTAG
jgi:hypothetical protein